jgi:hypothetical protein
MHIRNGTSTSMKTKQKDEPLTLSVPEAGRRYFGLSPESSYHAARTGALPTIRIGSKRLRVPVRAMERLLDRAGEPAK